MSENYTRNLGSAGQPEESCLSDAEHKTLLIKLLIKITVFYAILGVVTIAIHSSWPNAHQFLPFGGVTELAGNDWAATELQHGLSAIDAAAGELSSTSVVEKPNWLKSAFSLFVAMIATLILMLPVAWTYRAIHKGHDFDHSIDETAMLLPAIVAGIVAIVQYSLALAFSLAGIVAGVRFRRALNDTFDTLFIFVSIAVGLAAGIGSIEIAVAVTLFFNYATLILCLSGDGLQSAYDAQRKAEKKAEKERMKAARIEDERSSEL